MLKTYGAILTLPGAWKFSLAGLIARFPMAILSLGIVVFIQLETGSYAIAGLVAAVFMVAQAISNPLLAKAVDRVGQARVMIPVAIVHVLGLGMLLAAVYLHWWVGTVYIAAVISGASVGSVGSLVRARWTNVVKSPAQLHTAYSWESVMDEVLFVSGPVIVTFLATTVLPGAGLILAMITATIGSALFYVQKETEPVPSTDRTTPKGKLLSQPGFVVTIFSFVFLGVYFGALDVIAIALADEAGVPAMGGVLLGIFAAGSLLAGAIYGAVSWRAATHNRYVFSLCLLALGTGVLLLADGIVVTMISMFVAGLTIAPTLIGGNSVVQQLAPPRRLTEGFAWVGTAMGFGVAVGAAVSGIVVDAEGARAALYVPAVCAVVAAVVGLVFRTRMAGRTQRTSITVAAAD